MTNEPFEHLWKSSVMNTHGCENCRICAFLDGSRSTTDMLAVIKQLDATLAKKEEMVQKLVSAMASQVIRGHNND